MIIIIITILIILLINNLFINKKVLLTTISVLLTIFITYVFNANCLNYEGGFVGINNVIFLLLSVIFSVIMVIIKFVKKIKIDIYFIASIVMLFIINAFTFNTFGGLKLEGEAYFYRNFNAYINTLSLILIQVNLIINFICSKTENK